MSKEELPSIEDLLDENLPSVEDFIEGDDNLPSVENVVENNNLSSVEDIKEDNDLPSVEDYIEEETITIEDAEGNTFVEVEDIIPPWPELLKIINDVREEIPDIPEIKYYDAELEKLCEIVDEVRSEIPEVKYYDAEVEAICEQIDLVRNTISELPEVKYYDEQIDSIENRINLIKEDITNLPEPKYYDNDLQSIREDIKVVKKNFPWIEANFKGVEENLDNVNDSIGTVEEKISLELDSILETVDVKVFENKVLINEVKDDFAEDKQQILADIKESSQKIFDLHNEFKDDDRKLKKQIQGEYNKLKKSVQEQLEKYNQESVKTDELLFKYFTDLKEEISKSPEVKYYDEEIDELQKSVSKFNKRFSPVEGDIKSLYRIVEDIKKTQIELNEQILNEPADVSQDVGGGKDPLTPTDQKFATLDDLSKHYTLFVNRIQQQLSTVGGGGAGFIKDLADVSFNESTGTNQLLIYNGSKWVGIASAALSSGSGGDTDSASKLVLDVRNNNIGYALTIGTPVYQTAYNSGLDRLDVEESRASNSVTMPAKGVVSTDLANNTSGQIIVYGELEGVNTQAFDVGDELFVAPGGGLTNVRPTDPTHLVQKIAVVLKKSTANGAILVYGAGRTNDVPNTISIAGSITASTYYGDGSNLTGVGSTDNIITGTAATFTGNVNVSGATTFSNAITIDGSNYLQLNDSTNIIGHNGVNNLFRFTDSLQFRGNSMFFQEYDGTEYLRMNSTTGLTLKRDGNTKLQIETDGITVTGTINDHTIPSGSGTFALTSDVPTNNNELTNGAGYITTSFTNTNQLTNGAGFITTSFTNTNQLTNGAGFVTFTNNNQLTNGAGYITTSFTNTNQLTNGAGFITASDDITGTAAGLSGSPNITVSAITATSGEFSGNVTIGGTLTYEDVTSIDSVGLVTARQGINVNGGQIIVGSAFSVGQAGVVTASSFVGNLTGSATSLSGVSSSFLLDYNNFTNTPTIPTNNNELTNGAGFITASDNITGTSAGLSGTPNINVGVLTATTTSINGNVTITSTDDGSAAAPELTLYRNSASPAQGDYLGQIMFKGENSNGGQENYAKITGKITDETLGTEDGLIETAIKGNGSFTIVSRQRSDELQLINGVGISVDGNSTFTGDITANGNIIGDDSTNISGINSVTATSFHGDGSNLTGVASTDNIITGTAATFNNVVNVGTGITLDATSGIITATNFFGTTQGQVSYITATETLTNKTLRNPTFESGANSPEFLETRYVNATQQDFVQLYTGGSSGTYFTQGEYQKVATITPDGNNQNYTFNIRLTATSASNYQIINFTGGLRANTLPDLDFTVNFSEEHNGVRFIEPKLWTKETTTAGFILAFEYVHNQNLYGGVNVEATIIPRSSAQRANVAFNTTQDSEQSSIDTGFTERDPTLTLSTVNGVPIFGTEFKIEGSTDNDFETTITSVDATADRTITFPDSSGTVALLGDGVMSDLADDTTPQLGGNLDLNSKDITGTGNINVSGITTISTGIGTVHIGTGSTTLLVDGDARVTGILTIGQGSITLDPNAKKISGIDEIIVGTATTVSIKQNNQGNITFEKEDGEEASVGIGTTVSINTTGIITAATLKASTAFYPPIYTTAQRDALSVTEGAMIFNTTTKKMEFYDGTSWQSLPGMTLGLSVALDG